MKNYYFLIPILLLSAASCKAQKIIVEGAELTLVAEGYDFTEGPAADKNGNVYFTDQPNDRIVKWDASENSVSDWMKPSGRSNGLYFDHDGNLLSCADEKNELWRIDMNKTPTVLVDNFEGKKLGGPNDLWVDSKWRCLFYRSFVRKAMVGTDRKSNNRKTRLLPEPRHRRD